MTVQTACIDLKSDDLCFCYDDKIRNETVCLDIDAKTIIREKSPILQNKIQHNEETDLKKYISAIQGFISKIMSFPKRNSYLPHDLKSINTNVPYFDTNRRIPI